MRLLGWVVREARRALARWRGDLLVVRCTGDTLPARLPRSALILMVDRGDDWSAGLMCPCGCGRAIELLLPTFIEPRWSLTVDEIGRPTLEPSIWCNDGCKSHFFVRGGRIIWA